MKDIVMRDYKFAMNEENLGIHICITKNGMKDERSLIKFDYIDIEGSP